MPFAWLNDMHHDELINPLYGLMAEYDDADQFLAACEKVRDAGFTKIDGYAPFPVHGMSEALGLAPSKLPAMILTGGILGGLGGFMMLYYANVISYVWNIGGRPPNSWPAWIPITFECTVLGAGLTAVFGMILLNGLPQPYHPVFNVKAFDQASQTRFFVLIEAADPKFKLEETAAFMQSLSPTPLVVHEVPN